MFGSALSCSGAKNFPTIKGSLGYPKWFNAVNSGDLEYIKKHMKNSNMVSQLLKSSRISYLNKEEVKLRLFHSNSETGLARLPFTMLPYPVDETSWSF